jgi:hypothetical protein
MATGIKQLNKAVSKIVDEVQSTTTDKVFEFVKTYLKNESEFTAAFEEFKKTLKTDVVSMFSISEPVKKGADRKKREPSQYNIFIGEKIKELKATNSEKNGKELMKLAIEAWKAKPAA